VINVFKNTMSEDLTTVPDPLSGTVHSFSADEERVELRGKWELPILDKPE